MTDVQQRPGRLAAARPGAGAADPRPPPRSSRKSSLGAPGRAPGRHRLRGRPVRAGGPIAVIVGFVLMIFVHELGHYLAARRAGMKVTEFFLGFGPRIWSFRRGETEYGFKAIPLGAYVRIIGMNNLEEVPPADEPRTYRAKGYWGRFCVAVAGVGHELRAGARAAVRRPGRLRRAAGRHVVRQQRRAPTARPRPRASSVGDRILSVDGQTGGHLRRARPDHPRQAGREVTLVVERDGEELTKVVTLAERRPDSAERVGFLGIGPAYADEQVGALSGVTGELHRVRPDHRRLGRPAWPRSSAPSAWRTTPTCSPAHENADPQPAAPVARRRREGGHRRGRDRLRAARAAAWRPSTSSSGSST